MRITILGHSGLLLEVGSEIIIVDPNFDFTPFFHNAFIYNNSREIRIENMPAPTILALSRIPKSYDFLTYFNTSIHLVTPKDRNAQSILQAKGFNNVNTLIGWQSIKTKDLCITATPCNSDSRKIGILFEGEKGRFWHMSDADVTLGVGNHILENHGQCDVVSAKFQPSAQVIARYFRSLGPSFYKNEIIEWMETACTTKPRFVFPYHDDVSFVEPYKYLNRYAFPYNEEEIALLLDQRVGSKGTGRKVLPGDVIQITEKEVFYKPQSASFVRNTGNAEPIDWEPINSSSLAGLRTQRERDELKRQINSLLSSVWIQWLSSQINPAESFISNFQDFAVVWQLTVHMGEKERLVYSIDFTQTPLQLSRGHCNNANYFVHIAGKSLQQILSGTADSERLYACGDVRMYEKILHVRDGSFWKPPVEHMELFKKLPDPLIYYLRYSQPVKKKNILSSHNDFSIQPILSKEEPIAVSRKKVLLRLLAKREARRLGIKVSDEEVQNTSEQFRKRCNLLSARDTHTWLADSELSQNNFSDLMHDAALVDKLTDHFSHEIDREMPVQRKAQTIFSWSNKSSFL